MSKGWLEKAFGYGGNIMTKTPNIETSFGYAVDYILIPLHKGSTYQVNSSPISVLIFDQINPNTEVIFIKEYGEVAPGQEHGVEKVEDVEAEEKAEHHHKHPHHLTLHLHHL